MKLLIHNYSSEISTEPLYLNEAAKNKGIESKLWNNKESAFDIFDTFHPDIYITKWSSIRKDAVTVLSELNILSIINITGAENKVIEEINKLPFKKQFFKNKSDSIVAPIVPYCADIFMEQRNVKSPTYQIDKLFIVFSEEEVSYIKKTNPIGTYHIITPFSSSSINCDASLGIGSLYAIYPMYKEIFVFQENQIYYDAAYYGGECVNLKTLNKITKTQIIENHTPYNRLEAILNEN